MNLFRLPDKAKAILILVAATLGHLNRVAQHLVKIFDDSELTVSEAVEFTQTEGTIVLGKWRDRQPPESSAVGT